MRYVGSKDRITKYIVPFLLKDIQKDTVFYDVFCGGCSVVQCIDGNRVANDINKYLIAFFRDYVTGKFELPEKVTKELYDHIKYNKHLYNDALVGYIGYTYSYRSKWFDSFDNGQRNSNYRKEHGETAKVILERQKKFLNGVSFVCNDYINLHIKTNSIVYCDPPYSLTENAYGFRIDKDEFVSWCKEIKNKGCKIFISEYSMPEEFKCIIEIPKTTTLIRNNNKKSIEKLFVIE